MRATKLQSDYHFDIPLRNLSLYYSEAANSSFLPRWPPLLFFHTVN